MSKYAVVISEDAMVYEDTFTLQKLNTFSSVWDQAAFVKRVRSVYPSITYPAHATMMTGVYPDKHGIINNEIPTRTESAPWIHFRESVKAETIFDLAHAKGLTTAAVFWPVTGCDKSIDYLIDEYWPQTKDEGDLECFRNSGSSEEVLRDIVAPNLKFQKHRAHPICDDFIHICAADMIRKYKPNLMMLHPANIDAYRHHSGVFSDMVTEGLYEADGWLRWIIQATKDAGTYEDTDFFIVSDHGQMNISRTVAPNAIFAQRGLIQIDEAGNIKSWRAFCKSAALSAQVYINSEADREETYQALEWMREAGVYGISRVYTKEEVRREEHLDGDFEFVIETDGFTSFSNSWKQPVSRTLDISDYRFGRATHGHLPDKGPQPTIIAFGPDIAPGATLERANLTDIAPTVAMALGMSMEGTDGRALTELFK